MNLLNMLYSKIVAHFRHLLNGCNDTFVFSLTGLEEINGIFAGIVV
jgi:hypothetical protein